MSEPEDDPAGEPELPPTKLADFAKRAVEKLTPEPDKAGPAAIRTMAAIVRDLDGLPEVSITRESKHRLRLGRRGKVLSLALEYKPNIRALELEYINLPGADPTATKFRRYTFHVDRGALGEWHRMDDGAELIDDVQAAFAILYPELGRS
jgi:hypothetical protein